MQASQVSRAGEPAEVLRLVERPMPEPGAGQAGSRVDAAGAGLPDVFMCRHTYPFAPSGAFTPGDEAPDMGDRHAAGPGHWGLR